MTDDLDMDEAEGRARRRFVEAAETYRERLEDAWNEALPGNHSPADALILAHLMTANDGYHDVVFVEDWAKRPRGGWQTAFAFLAMPAPRLVVRFAFEARSGVHARQLAVIVDDHRPGERTPYKQQEEARLAALGFHVLVLTELEIARDPEACRDRVESVLFDLIEAAMEDAGVIGRKRDREPEPGPSNDR